MKSRSRFDSESIYQSIITAIVALLSLSMIFPLVYVVGMSLTSQSELISRNYFVIIPHQPVLVAYKRILSSPPIWNALEMSFVRSILGTVLSLLFMLVGAFVLSRKTLPGRKLFLLLVLITILFNGGLIPSYYVVKQLGIMNTLWAMIIPPLIDSFGLLVIKIFIENLPDSLIESVQLDGAGDFQQLVYIIAPLSGPALAAIGMFTVVNHWNSWFDALLYLSSRKDLYPLQMVLRNMMSAEGGGNDMMNFMLKDTERVASESIKMATVVIGILPIMMLYPFLQKYFIHGIYMGSVKG
jgi:putative aldouronate transport system permease protein